MPGFLSSPNGNNLKIILHNSISQYIKGCVIILSKALDLGPKRILQSVYPRGCFCLTISQYLVNYVIKHPAEVLIRNISLQFDNRHQRDRLEYFVWSTYLFLFLPQ